MGFFSDIGEALFGTQTKKQGQKLAQQGANATSAVGAQAKASGEQAAAQGQQYDAGASQSMGANAGEYMQKANQAAQGQAEQAGTAASTAGTQAALRAARSSGLNKGQAALTAGQQAGDIYSNTYQKGLESGRNEYAGATQQFAGQGNQMAGRQQNALNTQLGAATGQANIGQQQIANAQQTASNTWGTIGTIAGAAAGLSDEKSKDNVWDIGKIKATLSAYSPKVVSDEEAKTDIVEAPMPQTKDLTKYVDTSSTAGKGYSNGVKLGSALKEGFAKKPEAAISDENAKDLISDSRDKLKSLDVMEIAKKIRPVSFKYKKEIVDSGKATDGDKFGVIAQDLEKTPLSQAVKMGEDGLKRIDTTELTPALLNMVVQLAQEVSRLKEGK
jgi:hypothetical protein